MSNHWIKTCLLITHLLTHLLKNGSSSFDDLREVLLYLDCLRFLPKRSSLSSGHEIDFDDVYFLMKKKCRRYLEASIFIKDFLPSLSRRRGKNWVKELLNNRTSDWFINEALIEKKNLFFIDNSEMIWSRSGSLKLFIHWRFNKILFIVKKSYAHTC